MQVTFFRNSGLPRVSSLCRVKMEKIDPTFELYFVTALTNCKFGNDITPQDEIRAVQLTADRIDVVKTKPYEIFCFCEYFSKYAQ